MTVINDRDLLPIIQRLIGQGLIEKHDSTVTLTNKGRTAVLRDTLLRWQGIHGDAKILFGLWLKEQYDKGGI